jgi:hypothetical protein
MLLGPAAQAGAWGQQHDGVPMQTVVHYAADVEAPGQQWELCQRVLARHDVTEQLSRGWNERRREPAALYEFAAAGPRCIPDAAFKVLNLLSFPRRSGRRRTAAAAVS